jgi:hypothetical protein
MKDGDLRKEELIQQPREKKTLDGGKIKTDS